MADFAKILATLRKEEKQLANRAAQIRKAIEALTGSGAPIPLGKRKGPKKAAKKKPFTPSRSLSQLPVAQTFSPGQTTSL